MIDVRRLGAVTFKTTDLDRSLSYFSDMIGLIPVERSASRAVLATAEGLEVIVLERASEGGLAKLSFQIASDDLDAAAAFPPEKGGRPHTRAGPRSRGGEGHPFHRSTRHADRAVLRLHVRQAGQAASRH